MYREEEQEDQIGKTLVNPRLSTMDVSDPISGRTTSSNSATRVKTTPSNALEWVNQLLTRKSCSKQTYLMAAVTTERSTKPSTRLRVLRTS